ncbi:MAG: SAM-dependent methyltransferase [Halobacteriales archaeon]
MSPRDGYYRKAKREGYRARSAYKLQQIDDEVDLFDADDVVVDLGAAPGGWLQVASERAGRVVGVDIQEIDEIDGVDTVQGDVTEDATVERLRDAVDEADVVVSDMAPDVTGEWSVDHARSVHLARTALDVALNLLRGGGSFVVKVFQGRELDGFRDEVEREFEDVRTVVPDASRDESSEVYVVGLRRLTAPVRVGDVVEVEVESEGDEGDGVARVEGFVVFVPDTEAGDDVEVEVTEVHRRFARATKTG